jgi:ABC-type uncharacterized transport system substrate-binding protein
MRAANGDLERLPELLSELIAVKVDLIVTSGYPAARVVKERTKLPVVMAREGAAPCGAELSMGERHEIAGAAPKPTFRSACKA